MSRPEGVMAPRLPNWRSRLAAEITAAASRPWQWGAGGLGEPHDCLAFPARCVEAVTGEDLYEPFRGRYVDEPSARGLVPDVGAFLVHLAEREGWPEVHPREALDGDLALFNHGLAMGGVIYSRLVFPKSPSGLRTVTRGLARKVWAVGYASSDSGVCSVGNG